MDPRFPVPSSSAASLAASRLLTQRAHELQRSGRAPDFRAAVRLAMHEDRQLARAYAGDPTALPSVQRAPVKTYRQLPSAALVSCYGQTVKGVEIFRAGIWNGDKYTVDDLDDMVHAFKTAGFRPPVKLGHTDAPDAPAYGWVSGLRREGDRLIADFTDVPDDLIAMIRDGRYDAVSAEIFFNLKRNGQVFGKVLKAIAILGAHPPGVDLQPLRAALGAGA